MAYLNLLYRRKADTAAYQNERDELLKMADDLVDKVKDIKQKKSANVQPTLVRAHEGTHEGSFFRTSVVRRPR